MAVYGQLIGDKSIQIDACRWYAKGLENQRLQTQRLRLMNATKPPDVDTLDDAAICAPIMLALFESVMCKNFEAWSQHLLAAGELLEMRGPESCTSIQSLSMFRTIRPGHVSLKSSSDLLSFYQLTSVGIHFRNTRNPIQVCFESLVHNTIFSTSQDAVRYIARLFLITARALGPA